LVYTEAALGLSIRNPETVALARKLANLKGQGLTETIHQALNRALAEHDKMVAKHMTPEQATVLALEALRQFPATGPDADKAYFDDMWSQ
jgi:hypothetical protein